MGYRLHGYSYLGWQMAHAPERHDFMVWSPGGKLSWISPTWHVRLAKWFWLYEEKNRYRGVVPINRSEGHFSKVPPWCHAPLAEEPAEAEQIPNSSSLTCASPTLLPTQLTCSAGKSLSFTNGSLKNKWKFCMTDLDKCAPLTPDDLHTCTYAIHVLALTGRPPKVLLACWLAAQRHLIKNLEQMHCSLFLVANNHRLV